MHPGKDLRVAFAVGLAAAGLAALGLALALFNIELRLGIDRWLAPSAAVPELGPALLRVAIAGTLGFGLAGGALALVLLSQNAAFEVFENHIMKEIPVGT